MQPQLYARGGVIIHRLGELVDYLDFEMNDFAGPMPLGVTESTLLLVLDLERRKRYHLVLIGYLAEIIIDERTSVIPTGPDDTILLEDIALPENRFALEFSIDRGIKKIRFIEFNGAPL